MTFEFDPAIETALIAEITTAAGISDADAAAFLASVRAYYAEKIPSGEIALFWFNTGLHKTFTPPLKPWR